MRHFLILLSLVSLFSSAHAIQLPESNSQTGIIQVMSEIEPYLKLNLDKTVHFNSSSAKGKLSEKSFEMGKVYERFHNSMIYAIDKHQKPFQTEQDKKDLKIFEPFFLAVQKTGALTTKDLINTIPKISNSEIVPKGSLKLQKGDSINFSPESNMKTISFACNGGSMEKPAYCPAWQFATNQYTTQAAAATALKQMGYHNTFFPGCGWNYPCSVDYTSWLSVNGCFWGVFRSQAITYQSGAKWKIKFQSPEPNPEIKSYPWPSTWWGPYVVYWHQFWPQPNQLGC